MTPDEEIKDLRARLSQTAILLTKRQIDGLVWHVLLRNHVHKPGECGSCGAVEKAIDADLTITSPPVS